MTRPLGGVLPKGAGAMLLVLWSPKGGSGTSVVAAALALVAAGRGESRLADLGGDQPAILGLGPGPAAGGLPEGSAQRNVLGYRPGGVDGLAGWLSAGPAAFGEWLDELAVPVAPGLSVLPRGSGDVEAATAEAGAALAVALRDGCTTVLDAGSGAAPAAAAVVDVADVALVVLRPCYLALRRAVADPRLAASAGVVVVEEPGRALGVDDVAAVLGLPVVGRIPVRAEIARAVDAGVLGDRLPAALAGAAAAVLDGLADLGCGRWAA
ncbi:MAG TPA: hypothetical protein VFE55_19315 [Acidimicrobiia bacterium]|nr:hypothetical protein [Acidimicrobiia bacterium]